MVAYVSSQARGGIGAATARLQHRNSKVGSEPHLWPIPQMLNSQVRPEIKPMSSWILVSFITGCAKRAIPSFFIFVFFFIILEGASKRVCCHTYRRVICLFSSKNFDVSFWPFILVFNPFWFCFCAAKCCIACILDKEWPTRKWSFKVQTLLF